MKNERTNWTAPTNNIITAANDLRKCLAAGHKARLVRIFNEDCQHPILLNKNEQSKDFRDYEFSIGTLRTRAEINADTSMSDFEKELSLNYHACFGDADAVDKYYNEGVLSAGNLNGVGKAHLVKVQDMIDYYRKNKKKEDERHFYDTFRLKNRQERQLKHFNHKLWAVEMINDNTEIIKQPILLSILMFLIKIVVTPLKFIPERRRVDMGDYIWTTYRIGSVIHGISIDIHRGKKFSFK